MGEVYKARDPRLQRDVAIKVSAEQYTERFEREARAVATSMKPVRKRTVVAAATVQVAATAVNVVAIATKG